MCNINFMLGIKTGAAECLLNSPNAKFLHFQPWFASMFDVVHEDKDTDYVHSDTIEL